MSSECTCTGGIDGPELCVRCLEVRALEFGRSTGAQALDELMPFDDAVADTDIEVRPDLASRLNQAAVDLVGLIEGGIPERAWLPASERLLARGKRHHVAAPLKSGKSLAWLAHAVDMVAAGAEVAILDRENGSDEYARRLRDILADREPVVRVGVRDRLRYYAWPTLDLGDGVDLPDALGVGVDLVIFDSTRTFLSAFGLDEDRSNDFAEFAAAMIDPLFRAGVATLQLDNAGHGDSGRARGSSSKGDLADVLYSLKTVAPFDSGRTGSVKLTRRHSRFGDVAPAFLMELGAGSFGRFQADDEARAADNVFRPTVLMERVSLAVEARPGIGIRAIREQVRGNNPHKVAALDRLVAEGFVRVERDGRATRHYSERPFRETDDTDCAHVPKPCPNGAQGTVEDHVPTVPLPKGGTGHRHIPKAPPDGAYVPIEEAQLVADLVAEFDATDLTGGAA